MSTGQHGAIGPALGYYYQAIFALITLFESDNDNAFISIESLDDVYHEDGAQKNLIQLKHSVKPNTVITVKSNQLWATLNVWCDYIASSNVDDGIFTLATVASLRGNSSLRVLGTKGDSRELLENDLLTEAKRVINERKQTELENVKRRNNKEKELVLPYESKFKGCEAFIGLTDKTRKTLLKNMRLNTSSFSIDQAQNEVIKHIRVFTQSQNYSALADSIIGWWDREAVKSLTKERRDCIFFSELQEFISKKIAELYNDGFTDDLSDLELPQLSAVDPVQLRQLEIIDASRSQIRRSRQTEMLARIQRDIWMKNSLPAISKLQRYDETLISEWSYKFEEIEDNSSSFSDGKKKEEGRKLLDWSHNEAHTQIDTISKKYSNPNLIRGSYQLLSKNMSVGWHCDFKTLVDTGRDND